MGKLLWGLLVAALVSVAVSNALTGTPAHAASKPASSKRASRPAVPAVPAARLASKLAHAIDGARTLARRTKAVLRAVEALGYPVVASRTGKPVYSGNAAMPKGLLLYDFELRAVASELASARTLSFEDFTALLGRAGFKPGGNEPDPVALQRALVDGVARATRRPRSAASLVPLLLRDLGLDRARGRVDLV